MQAKVRLVAAAGPAYAEQARGVRTQAKVRRRLFPSRPTIRQGVVPNHQERELLQAEGLVIGAAGAVQAKDRLCGSTVLGGVAAASQPLMLTVKQNKNM